MKWRCPTPGTGAMPTMFGAMWKCPSTTEVLNDAPACTTFGPANLTVGLTAALGAGAACRTDAVCVVPDAPQPASAEALTTAAMTAVRLISSVDRPPRGYLEPRTRSA